VPITLSSQERARLKARAHSLAPVVRMGNAGITPTLAAEVDRALTAHELIKISIAVDDREERRALGDALAERLDAAPVHRVGKILILWRAGQTTRSTLSRANGLSTKRTKLTMTRRGINPWHPYS
jgi:putative YhbY family RNA-binding protein